MQDFRRVWAISLSLALAMGAAGCKKSSTPDTTNPAQGQDAAQYPAQDPASANLAPASNATDNTGAPPSGGQTAPAQPQYAATSNQPNPNAEPYSSDSNYDENSGNYENVAEYASEPPPELPDYQQPPCPGDGYIWTPGYWNYDSGQGYYWVPGAWVMAPFEGALWTPGWWGSDQNRYAWHRGSWGRHVGYYGGVDYGYGYGGYGYQGGYWRGNQFAYNRVANNVNTSVVHNVYDYRFKTENNTRVSYNGGSGGVQVRPRPTEIAALHEGRVAPMAQQTQLIQQARSNRQNFARVDHGRPAQPVASQPLRADANVRAPEPRNPQAIPPQPQRPGQPRNVPPPQQGHSATNVKPQSGGPKVGEPARGNSGAGKANGNGRQQHGSGTPARTKAPQGIPAHAVGPEPAVPRQRPENQPQKAAQQRPAPAPQRAVPSRAPTPRAEPQRTEPSRATPQSRPAPQRRPAQPSRPTPQTRPTPKARPAPAQRAQPQKAQPEHKEPKKKPEDKQPQ
jgi:hypothetical protein